MLIVCMTERTGADCLHDHGEHEGWLFEGHALCCVLYEGHALCCALYVTHGLLVETVWPSPSVWVLSNVCQTVQLLFLLCGTRRGGSATSSQFHQAPRDEWQGVEHGNLNAKA